jgi:hypothetical protein
MMQDGDESAQDKKDRTNSKMLESDGASPIGNESDNRGGKRAASGPDSSDNDLMEINQQLPNGKRQQSNQNLFDNEDEEDYEDKQ